jgi:hypothetical protein
MKRETIREIAKRMGINARNMNQTKLIRAIQSAEGNSNCFATHSVNECNQVNCLWRQDCAKTVTV